MATTMVKAEVGETTNNYIERVVAKTDMNKAQAAAYLLRKAAMSEYDETGKWKITDGRHGENDE